MTPMLERLLDRQGLSESQSATLLNRFVQGEVDTALGGALLAALRSKGESAAELRGFARAMSELAVDPEIAEAAGSCDVVGTGGDGSGSLNLSTGAALLAAACGVPVIKHGNRAVSSRCGSSDVLEALGVPLSGEPARAREIFRAAGFVFLPAPAFHPALRAVAPLRRRLGVRTVFNLLGPLTNPASPGYRLIGAASGPAAVALAEALAGMPVRRAFVVHGENGWDEPTPVCPYTLHEVRDGRVTARVEDPRDHGFARCAEGALLGSTPERNAAMLRDALSGGGGEALRDALVLGAALTLRLTGRVADARDARQRALSALQQGRASALVDRLGAV